MKSEKKGVEYTCFYFQIYTFILQHEMQGLKKESSKSEELWSF